MVTSFFVAILESITPPFIKNFEIINNKHSTIQILIVLTLFEIRTQVGKKTIHSGINVHSIVHTQKMHSVWVENVVNFWVYEVLILLSRGIPECDDEYGSIIP